MQTDKYTKRIHTNTQVRLMSVASQAHKIMKLFTSSLMTLALYYIVLVKLYLTSIIIMVAIRIYFHVSVHGGYMQMVDNSNFKYCRSVIYACSHIHVHLMFH